MRSKPDDEASAARALFDASPAPMFAYRRSDLRLCTWNPAFLATYGYDAAEAGRLGLLDLCLPGERETVAARAHALHGAFDAGLWCHLRRDGSELHVLVRSDDVRFADEDCRLLSVTPVALLERSRIVERQRLVLLERLAHGQGLGALLEQLVRDHEAMFPGSLCAVLLLDAPGCRLQRVVAPSLPLDFVAALDGLAIGSPEACCGPACSIGQRVDAAGLQTRSDWAGYREPARRAGLHPCASEPILGPGGRVLGALTVQRRIALPPGDEELGHLQYAVQLAATAIAHDQTLGALQRSEQRLRSILQAMPDLVFLKDAEGRYQACNAAFERFTGHREAELIGRRTDEITDPDSARRNEELDALALAQRLPVSEERWLDFRDGGTRGFFELVKTPLFDAAGRSLGVLGVGRDITERRRNEARIERLNRSYSLLSGVNEAVVRVRDREALFGEICRIAVQTGGFRLAWIGMHDTEAGVVRMVRIAGESDGFLQQLQLPVGGERRSPILDALQGSAPRVVQSIRNEPLLAHRRAQLLERGLESMAIFPIVVQGLPWHALAVYSDTPAHFDDEQVELLARLARDIGFALEFIGAEKARSEAQRLHEQIVESVAGLFFAIDTRRRLVLWNRRIVELIGREPIGPEGDSVLVQVEPEDRERVEQALHEGFERGQVQVEARVRAADGSRALYLLTARRVVTAAGPLLAGTGTDISERVRNEEELARYRTGLERLVRQRTAELEAANLRLKREDRRLRAMLLLSQRASTLDEDALLQQALAEVVALAGSAVAAVFEASAEPAAQPPRLLAARGDPSPSMRALAALLARGEIPGLQGAAPWPADAIGAAARDAGQPTLVLCTGPRAQAYDASDLRELQLLAGDLWRVVQRRRTELALERAKAAADAASQAKSAFLANMSHEIRTPMNAVLGFAHLLRRDPLTPRQLDHLDKIAGASQHLLQIISDILDFSKIEADRMTLEQTTFDLRESLLRVQALQADEARARQLVLSLHLDPGCPRRVRGDPLRLEQVLLNLLSNAIKFTPKGRVELRVAPAPAAADASMLRFEVRDTGIGMTQAQQRQVFEAFAQADASTTRRFGGTGLGLAICRRLVQMMGGEIGVDSQPGQGSCFWLLLPQPALVEDGLPPLAASADPAQATAPAAASALQGKRILVAEDNPVNQEVVGAVLSALGVQVELAADGSQALQRFRARRPDLVLMDVQMPGVDGLQATAAIRALPTGAAVPIVAMTANAFAESRAQCLEAGMNDFLSKPVEPRALERCLRQWLLPASTPTSAPLVAASPHLTAGTAGTPGAGSATGGGREWPRPGPGFDATAARARLSGNAGLYLRMLQTFVAHHGEDATQLLAFADQGRTDALHALAHALIGAASAIGAVAIEQAARELQALTGASTPVREQGRAVRDATQALVQALHSGLAALNETLMNEALNEKPAEAAPDAPGPSAAADDEASLESSESTQAAQAVLQRLRPLLASHDTAALALFERERASLGRAFGAAVEELGRPLNAFDFGAALAALQRLTGDARQHARDPGRDQPAGVHTR
jgi:PAS domain S-box-containing protein